MLGVHSSCIHHTLIVHLASASFQMHWKPWFQWQFQCLQNFYEIFNFYCTLDSYNHYSTLLHDCFLSAPLPFLCNCSWDLSKLPNSYHAATTHPDNAMWLAVMHCEFESLEKRKAFKGTTPPPSHKPIGVVTISFIIFVCHPLLTLFIAWWYNYLAMTNH